MSAKRTATVGLAIMLGGAALALASQPGGAAAANTGVFRGYLDTQDRRGPVEFALHIAGYSSDEDLKSLETMLREKGQEAMFAAVGDMKPNGWLQLDHGVGYPVTVLGEQETREGRRIVAIADRPIRFREFWRGSRSRDYPFTLIVLNVNDLGLGQGTLIPAARAELDRQGNITFDDYRRIPYRILRVREDRAAGS